MIPRRFFWAFDLFVLCGAFLAAYALVPFVKPLLEFLSAIEPHGLKTALTLQMAWADSLPTIAEAMWIVAAMAPAAFVALGLSGNHDALLNLSKARIILGCLLASFAGLSVIALTLFAVKRPGWSRLLIFLFTIFTAAGLIGYRLVLRKYFMARR